MAGIPWTESEANKLKEMVPMGKYSLRQLETFFPGRTASGMQEKCNQFGLKNPYQHHKYEYDRTFFHTPNPVNCYFAGIIAADGSFSKRDSNIYDLAWGMNSIDEELLYLLKEKLGYTGEIEKFYKTGEQYKKKDGDFHSRLRLNNLGQMYDDIERNFALTPNKTYRLPPPNLDSIELKLCYLRGYYDGDGCVCLSNNFSIGITSASIKILEWVKNITDSLDLPSPRKKKNKNISKETNAECYRHALYGVQAIYFYELLKLTPTPMLKRKWDRPNVNLWVENFKKENPDWFKESIESVLSRNNIKF